MLTEAQQDAFRTQVQAILASVDDRFSDVKVVWAQQNAPRPAPPCCVLRWTAGPIRYSPHDARFDADGDGETMDTTLAGPRRGSISAQVSMPTYGPAEVLPATSIAGDLQTWLGFDAVLSALGEVEIAIIDTPTVQDLTAVVDSSRRESRAVLDITVGYVSSVSSEDTDYFNRVQASGVAGGHTLTIDEEAS